jgi:hypothetical protein
MMVSGWHELADISQSIAMVFIVITQIGILMLIRNEMRRASSMGAVMSRAMGRGRRACAPDRRPRSGRRRTGDEERR